MTEVIRGRRWARGRRFRRGVRRDLPDVVEALAAEGPAARQLLRRAVRARGDRGVRVRPEEAGAAEVLADGGLIRLEEKVTGTAAEPRWLPWRAVIPIDTEMEIGEWLGIADPGRTRAELLTALLEAPLAAVENERKLLAAMSPDAPLRPPKDSMLAGCSWSVYAAALRAGACWAQAMAEGRRPSARELAAQSLGWSKAWTPTRREAFSRLVGQPFDGAVATQERFIRLRGPVSWSLDGRVADARAAVPWVGLPESGVERISVDASAAVGTLIVENLETFEELCRHSTVPHEWVCVFGSGYGSTALVTLLTRLPRPFAAWGDIDPHGVAIVADLSRRIGEPVNPVCMDAEELQGPFAIPASDEQVADAHRLAGEVEGPLKELAIAVGVTRRVLEQEPVQFVQLSRLPEELLLLRRRRPPHDGIS